MSSQELRRVTFRCPVCDVCNKEVDRFELNRIDDRRSVLVAYCHGDVSQTEPFEEWQLDQMYSYRAFMDPRRKTDRGKLIRLPDVREQKGQWVGALDKWRGYRK